MYAYTHTYQFLSFIVILLGCTYCISFFYVEYEIMSFTGFPFLTMANQKVPSDKVKLNIVPNKILYIRHTNLER